MTDERGRDRGREWNDRRRFLQAAVVGVGALWVAPARDSFATPAAAASGTATAGLFKAGRGSRNPSLSTLCLTGPQTGTHRGSVAWTRTDSASTISVTITLSTGTSITGRGVHILQSTGSTCVGGTGPAIGTWAASPSQGPQTFSTALAPGATHFVVVLSLSGGAGNDDYASSRVTLP